MPTVAAAPRANILAAAFQGGRDQRDRDRKAKQAVAPRVWGPKGSGKGSTQAEQNRQKCYSWDDGGRSHVSPEKTLDAIDDYLKAKNIGPLEMMMHRPHAPRLQPDPQEWLDAREFRETLGATGINLTVDDVRAVFNHVDSNRDQNIQVAELERALKRHRKMRTRQARPPAATSLDWAEFQNPRAANEDPSVWERANPPAPSRAGQRARSQDVGPRPRNQTYQPASRATLGSAALNSQEQDNEQDEAKTRNRSRTCSPPPRDETGRSRGQTMPGGPRSESVDGRKSTTNRARYEAGVAPDSLRAGAKRASTTRSGGQDGRNRSASSPPAETTQDSWQRQATEEWDGEDNQESTKPNTEELVIEDVRQRAGTSTSSPTALTRRKSMAKTMPDPDTLPALCQNADPGTVLDCMNDTIEYKGLRVGDFFRNNSYNPEYKGHGEQEVDAKAVQDMFLRASTNIDTDAMADCMEAVSPEGSGKMTVGELEDTLRKRRGGKDPWKDEDFIAKQRAAKQARSRRSMSPSARKSVVQDLVGRLYQPRTIDDMREPEEETAPQKDDTKMKPAKDGTVFERLYKHAAENEDKKRKLREDWLVEDLSQLDVVGHAAAKKGVDQTNRHLQLYEESKQRKERIEHSALAARAQERLVLKLNPNQEVTSTPEDRMKRIENLHEQHKEKLTRRGVAAKESDERQIKNIEAARDKAKDKRADEKSKCGVKNEGLSSISARFMEPKKVVEAPVVDPASTEKKGAAKLAIETVDHVLGQLNSDVSLRCGRGPEDADSSRLREVMEPLKAAIEAHRSALLIRGQKKAVSNEVRILEDQSSMSPWDGYHLRPDLEGWRANRAPDVIHQLYDRPDDLMNFAAVAQNHLLALIAFGDAEQTDKLGKRWPPQAIWRRPHSCSRSSFAYNPGVKSSERARRKAWVRYAPACDNHLVHLTDLARVALVFEDAVLLRAGLQDILEKFEVIDVRNFYNRSCQNLLGERYVEVLVTVSADGLPQPMICEIRLEENSYFEARQKSSDNVAEVCKAFADMYGNGQGFDKGAIEYLAEWTLKKPKETHSMGGFRRGLRRRYGSAVAAWRSVFGVLPNANFGQFREWCFAVNEPDHVAEYWMQADCTRSGFISLFEVDPEAVILLAEIRMRILDFWGGDEKKANGEDLFQWLTKGVSLLSPGKITRHELRAIFLPLDILPNESDTVFFHLDVMGGDRTSLPNHIVPADITFLLKLPFLVNLRAASLGKPSNQEHGLEHFREIQTTAKGRHIEPGVLQGRHAVSRKARANALPEPVGPLSPPRYGARQIQRAASRALPPNILKMVRTKNIEKQAALGGVGPTARTDALAAPQPVVQASRQQSSRRSADESRTAPAQAEVAEEVTIEEEDVEVDDVEEENDEGNEEEAEEEAAGDEAEEEEAEEEEAAADELDEAF